MNIEQQIEAILLFKNEPVTHKELASYLGVSIDEVKSALHALESTYTDRGIVVVSDGESVTFGTSKDASALIEKIQKDELSRELGRAGLETLAIVLYKGPVSRREIDYIRGVNSGFILRNLLVRGLIERTELAGERSFSYKPTLELLRYLGVSKREELPEYGVAFKKLIEFAKNQDLEDTSKDT
jgi:segregation and condensation protein B